jgi:predicted GNAT superfamily acetyltransferase
MDESRSAWGVADRSAERSGVRLRRVDGLEDVDAVAGVIERVWGPEIMPPALLRAFQHAGAVLHGAEEGGRLVGFVLGFLGWDQGLHCHSHMLAVVPEWQSRGVGYALKLAQRATCLDHGIDEVRWTYDPLVARNAWFNLVKLGAVATAYLPGFYGEMPDKLNRGDRSDRFEVCWRLTSDRVERAIGSSLRPADPDHVHLPAVLDAAGPSDAPAPVERLAALGPPEVAAAIPADHPALRAVDPGLGGTWRQASGRAFRALFDAGYIGMGIDRQGRYRFVKSQEPAR